MFCEKCGAKVSSDDAFCTNCGSQIKKDEVENTVETEKAVTETNTAVEANVDVNNTVSENVTESVQPSVTTKIEKENIKKGASGNVVAIILIILLALAAIGVLVYFLLFKGGEKPLDAIEKAINNMTDMESYTFIVTADVSMDGEEPIDGTASLEANIDMKNKMIKINGNLSASGISFDLPGYVDLSNSSNGMVYFKLPSAITQTDEWSKISLGEIDLSQFTNETKEIKIKDTIKDVKFIEKIKSDEDNCDKYKVVLNEENIKKIKEADESIDIDFESLKEAGFEDGISFNIYVNKKENYISKIEINFADYFKNESANFKKLDIIIEMKDINKVEEIKVPSDAKKAKEFDLSSISGTSDDNNNQTPVIPDDDNTTYKEDYTITEYGYKVAYKMPSGFEASEYNSEDFKIYRNDEIRAVISSNWDSKDEWFDDIESDKEYYETSEYYKNIVLSDAKTLTANGKEFTYKELSYETTTGMKKFAATICYKLDDEHVYTVELEKENSQFTNAELYLFLDITVTEE